MVQYNGVLGFWGFGVLGFWGFGVLGFWGFGVLAPVHYSEMRDTEDALLGSTNQDNEDKETALVFVTKVSKRKAGILGAVFNGIMTGSSLVPLHYAKKQGFGGAKYMISFATGAVLSNILVWMVYFVFLWVKTSAASMPGSSLWQTYSALPSWHVRQLLAPGFISGKTIRPIDALFTTFNLLVCVSNL